MHSKFLLLGIVTILSFSCRKEYNTINPLPPPPTPQSPPVLLKDITITNLPSPYYHFEYDTAGKVNLASFASDLLIYDIAFGGEKISQMTNFGPINHDTLQYQYDNAGRVTTINYLNTEGIIYKAVHLSYENGKLSKLERDIRLPAGFTNEKTMTFLYQADGNLLEITDHHPAILISGQVEATFIDLFQEYDTKINTDAFSLLHTEFFDNLILLPGIQLQKNNPGKVTRTGNGENYQITYSYTYNDKNAPLIKTGDLLMLNGASAGQHFQVQSLFSYYP
jgi:hypothetical protein